ncbi:hypothetical protein B7463_g2995, partial [Scytalidium lignicola]
MGDHVCKAPAPDVIPSGEVTPPPESATSYDRLPETRMAPNAYEQRPARNIPPRVDTMAANRPFFRQDQLTPMSADSRSISPMTPNSVGRSPYGPPRSGTGLTPRRPPSPDAGLSSNLDCAFPPFPAKKPEYGGHQAQGKSIGRGSPNLMVEADPMYAPVSPRTATSGGLLLRMNTIAPGPFDVRGRQGSVAGLENQQQVSASVSDGMQGLSLSSAFPEQNGQMQRPSTASSVHSRPGNSSMDEVEASRPKMPRTNGYGGFGPPTADSDPEKPKMLDIRSQTFPIKNESPESLTRRPSDIAAGSMMKRPSMDAANGLMNKTMSTGRSPPRERRPSNFGPDLTRPPPPRIASMSRQSGRPGDARPLPNNINLAAEFGAANPYHTPTESRSSNNSEYSEDSKASSRSSPPSTSPERPSNVPSMNGPRANFQPPKPQSTTAPPMESEVAPVKQQYASPMRNFDPSLQSPESPMDPAIQRGLSYAPPPRSSARPPPPSRSQTVPLTAPLTTPAAPTTKAKPRPSISKGNCKACSLPIKGRSVSSADGRLTGRYHKECFVCTTCSEPFNSTTFYVLNDAPYCEQHYHKLNGSICVGCHRGIEGQFLESERRQKFHPGCLRCMDCSRVLKHDYFEMNGRVYCERDAFRRAQQGRFLGVGGGGGGGGRGGYGGPSNRMERRTTRLMMM